MSNLSLQNLSRILNLPNSFSVKNDMFSIGGLPSQTSLKENLDFLDAMLEFAPEVRLNPDDETRPSSVEFFMNNCDLWHTGEVIKFPRNILLSFKLIERPNLEQLLSQSRSKRFISLFGRLFETGPTERSGMGSKTNFSLRIREDNEENTKKGEHTKFRNGQITSNVPCYCHAREVPGVSNVWDFQYLFFYPFNAQSVIGIGDHEGDWEHITVRVDLDNNREISGVYFSAHDEEGGWAKNLSPIGPTLIPRLGFFSKNQEGQIIVFSANDSHASYEGGPGMIDRAWPKPNDFLSDQGPIWNCRGRLLFVGERGSPSPGQEWIKFTGSWGTIDGPWFQNGIWWSELERPNAPVS